MPRLVEQYLGTCEVKLRILDDKDYLLIKSYGPSIYTVKGKTSTKDGPQYTNFNSECLLEYANVKVDRLTFDLLAEEEKTTLSSY